MNILLHKWLPRFFYKKFDGGPESGVTGYFLIEWKPFFSIGLLHFKEGSRENFHEHAFGALSWFLKGSVTEQKMTVEHHQTIWINKDFKASLIPKFTPRSNCHRVISHSDTWALTFRGPWKDHWREYKPKEGKFVTLTHGRKIVERLN